jgi:hypothetical protein
MSPQQGWAIPAQTAGKKTTYRSRRSIAERRRLAQIEHRFRAPGAHGNIFYRARRDRFVHWLLFLVRH